MCYLKWPYVMEISAPADEVEKEHTHIHCEPCWREVTTKCETSATEKSQATHRILSAMPFLFAMKEAFYRVLEYTRRKVWGCEESVGGIV